MKTITILCDGTGQFHCTRHTSTAITPEREGVEKAIGAQHHAVDQPAGRLLAYRVATRHEAELICTPGATSTTLAEVWLAGQRCDVHIGGNKQVAAWIGDQGWPAGLPGGSAVAADLRFFFSRPA